MTKKSRPGGRHLPKDLNILHEDENILVVSKRSGLLTMGTERDKTRTAYAMLTDYVRKGCAKSSKRIFIVHRLDRDTSGILVFAKNVEAKARLQGRSGGNREEISRCCPRQVREKRGDNQHLSG